MKSSPDSSMTGHLKVVLGNALVFVDHHSSPPQHHPCPNTAAKPDICAIPQSYLKLVSKGNLLPKKIRQKIPKELRKHKIYVQLPWHLFNSVCELKPKRDSAGPSQVGAYAGLLNQARPDKPGVYCLSLSPRKYRVFWSDSSGLILQMISSGTISTTYLIRLLPIPSATTPSKVRRDHHSRRKPRHYAFSSMEGAISGRDVP
jgi:hypothetical protein